VLKQLTSISPFAGPGKIMRLPLRLIPSRTVVTVRSGVNKGCRWIVGSGVHRYWLGTFEQEIQDLVGKLIRPGMTVWDLGANVGFYTLAYSRLVGSQGEVIAFEPLAANFSFALRHVQLNQLQNVTLVQGAVADVQNFLGLTTEGPKARLSADEKQYLIPIFSLDWFQQVTGRKSPALMKIDVEGAEAKVLIGALQMLKERRPDILLSLHGPEAKRQCLQILRDLSYNFFSLEGKRFLNEAEIGEELMAVTRQSL